MTFNEKNQLVIGEGDLFTGDQNEYIGLIYEATATATEPGEVPNGGKTHSIVFYDPEDGETRDEFPIATLSEDLKDKDRLNRFVQYLRDAIRQEYST